MTLDTRIKIEKAILNYPNLYEPKAFKDGKPVFSSKVLLDKTTHKETIEKIKTQLKKICEENKLTHKPDNFKCFKDGILSGEEALENYYILTTKANASRPPKVVGHDKEEYKGPIESGCVAHVLIDFWYYNFEGVSKGIACNLVAVQFVNKGDGKFFSKSNVDVDTVFDIIETEAPF